MNGLRLRLEKTEEFLAWYVELEGISRTRIDARLEKAVEGHFGDSRSVGGGLFELKWKNGLRVYYSLRRVGEVDMIVLWGGFKGTQDADIAKAHRLKTRYEHELKRNSL